MRTFCEVEGRWWTSWGPEGWQAVDSLGLPCLIHTGGPGAEGGSSVLSLARGLGKELPGKTDSF